MNGFRTMIIHIYISNLSIVFPIYKNGLYEILLYSTWYISQHVHLSKIVVRFIEYDNVYFIYK